MRIFIKLLPRSASMTPQNWPWGGLWGVGGGGRSRIAGDNSRGQFPGRAGNAGKAEGEPHAQTLFSVTFSAQVTPAIPPPTTANRPRRAPAITGPSTEEAPTGSGSAQTCSAPAGPRCVWVSPGTAAPQRLFTHGACVSFLLYKIPGLNPGLWARDPAIIQSMLCAGELRSVFSPIPYSGEIQSGFWPMPEPGPDPGALHSGHRCNRDRLWFFFLIFPH